MKTKPFVLLGIHLALCLLGMFAAPWLMVGLYSNYVAPDVHEQAIPANYVVWGGMVVGLAGLGFFFALLGRAILKWSLLGWAIAAGFVYAIGLLIWLVDSLMRYFVPDL